MSKDLEIRYLTVQGLTLPNPCAKMIFERANNYMTDKDISDRIAKDLVYTMNLNNGEALKNGIASQYKEAKIPAGAIYNGSPEHQEIFLNAMRSQIDKVGKERAEWFIRNLYADGNPTPLSLWERFKLWIKRKLKL